MALSIFDDKLTPPTEASLKQALGNSFAIWNELKKALAANYPPVSFEWGFTSKSTGWGLRIKHKERVILYMTPCEGYFLASLALGDKAVKAARESNLPNKVLKIIAGSRRYAEGTGVRLEIRSISDLRIVEKLAAIKLSH
ncbi:MAG TPA: DUF3788 domain-containing protein [Pyrinomonadaceae bacterium]|nr:DUF3788 domain-containing protein [Pyrinomonadaceae bacterium]